MDKERLLKLGNALDSAGIKLDMLDHPLFKALIKEYMNYERSLEEVVSSSKKLQMFRSLGK